MFSLISNYINANLNNLFFSREISRDLKNLVILSAPRELLPHFRANINHDSLSGKRFGLEMLILESTSSPSGNTSPENRRKYRQRFLTTMTFSVM